MSKSQRYKERAAELGMRLLSAIPPGPCGQMIPGPTWTLAVEMNAHVFDKIERCWAACEGLDLAAGETESVWAELTRLREIESNAKAAGFIGEDGKVRKVAGTLPVTADGVIVIDQRVFHPDLGWFPSRSCAIQDCYSTREAAQAAREGNK